MARSIAARSQINTTPFQSWRDRMNITQAQAAELLGVSKRTIETYDRLPELPQIIFRACRDAELERNGLIDKFVHKDCAGIIFYPGEDEMMAQFFGISQGEEKTAPGIRVRISDDGERVWMHGKWLDLGSDHAVIWIDGKAEFCKADGNVLKLGQFPAWVVRGTGKHPVMAAMFSKSQFEGGSINLINRRR